MKRMKKYHIYLTYDERQEIINALIDKRNDLIDAGHDSDAIDKTLEKVIHAKCKRVKVKEVSA